jgi:hypothetical protein
MNEALIQQIAQSIVKQEITGNWLIYVILIALSLLSGTAVSFCGAYLRKRGETYATKADFEELVNQLKTTTRVAEEVKTAIAKADWAEREWQTLRKVKLEELLEAMNASDTYLTQEQGHVWFQGPPPDEKSQITKFEALAALYFPELRKETSRFVVIYCDFRSRVIGVQRKLLAVDPDAQKKTAVLDENLDGYKKHAEEIATIKNEMTNAAAGLMRQIAGVEHLPQPAANKNARIHKGPAPPCG